VAAATHFDTDLAWSCAVGVQSFRGQELEEGDAEVHVHENNVDAFDEGNRAWQRLTAALGEHTDLRIWRHADTDRPVLVSVGDPGSGDTVTLSVVDSQAIHDPHVVISVSRRGWVAVYGWFDGLEAAAAGGAQLALADTGVEATKPARLHAPDGQTAALVWEPVPDELIAVLQPEPLGDTTVAVVLLDRDAKRLTLVGPFPDQDAADDWDASAHTGYARLTVPLHAAP
jgi:hypothetical protein